MNSEYYCGLPQNQWDLLAEQAEEILRDQEYGQHILGLYPAGSRIYGIESSSPRLLCLYTDVVDSLINPASTNNSSIFRKEYVGDSNSAIYFIELYSWSKLLRLTCAGSSSNIILPIIPAVQDIFYEDESVSSIISAARDMFDVSSPYLASNSKYKALQMRALAIYRHKKVFSPCINKDLGHVVGLDELGIKIPEYILELDKKIIDAYAGQYQSSRPLGIPQIEELYTDYLATICQVKNYKDIIQRWAILGSEVANLYRYQL
jgi:hypothetical protein